MLEEMRFIVNEQDAGLRLDKYLAVNIPTYSRSLITEWIKDGQVLLNETVGNPKDKVRSGDNIFVQERDTPCALNPIAPEEGPLDIVYQAQHYLILNKAPGLVVHPGAGAHQGTLVHFLAHAYPDTVNLPNWGLIHRLDKDTSGLLLVALTLEGYHELNMLMQQREISRLYSALIWGDLRYGRTIDAALTRSTTDRLKRAVSLSEFARKAITHVRIISKHENATFVECQLETGRTHQIRVHLEHIGHPIVGDQTYFGRHKRKHPFPRQALHASKLSFFDKWQQQTIQLEAPIPQDFQELLDSWGK